MSNHESVLVASLSRLVRAAEGLHVANTRLLDAAMVVGNRIESCAPLGIILPRGYVRCRLASDRVGCSQSFLFRRAVLDQDSGEHRPVEAVNCSVGGHIGDDYSAPYVAATSRAVALAFAKDVADGLIAEIAAFVEERAAVSNAAAEVLEAHAPAGV